MLKITKQIPFQRFHKSEIRNLVKEVLATVALFPSLSVLIKILLDRLSAVFDQIEASDVKPGKHPDTDKLKTNRSRCMVLITSIVSQVKNIKKANLESQVDDLALVDVFVRDYLKPIIKADWSDRSNNLDKMFTVLESNSSLQTAMENLNLKMLFDELRILVDHQDVIKKSRSSSLMRKKRANTAELRSAAITALREVFVAIELAQIQHPEADFTEMINGINLRVEYYSAQTKSRKTRNKNKPDDSDSNSGSADSTKAA